MAEQVATGRVVMHRYGPPRVLEWARAPACPLAPDEVRLRTVASAVNRADLEIRSGSWPVQQDSPFPYTPGLETLGRVEQAGKDVTTVRNGQLAITMMQRLGGIHGVRPGGYAETVTVPASSLAVVPEDVDPMAVAAMGLAAVTALEGLRRVEPLRAGRVVVLGASGGVGSAAVSFAAEAGADVVAVVSRPDAVDYVRSLGAAEVVVLGRSGRLLDHIDPRSVDGVLETLGARTFADSTAVLRRGGRLCVVGALTGPDLRLSAWDLLQDLRLTGWSSENLTGEDLRADVATIVGSLRRDAVVVPGWSAVPLPEAARAHELLQAGGVTGRLLLVPG